MGAAMVAVPILRGRERAEACRFGSPAWDHAPPDVRGPALQGFCGSVETLPRPGMSIDWCTAYTVPTRRPACLLRWAGLIQAVAFAAGAARVARAIRVGGHIGSDRFGRMPVTNQRAPELILVNFPAIR